MANNSDNRESQHRIGQFLDRESPHNLDAEEGLLAACIIDGGIDIILLCVNANLTEEGFYKPAHKLIYSAIINLFNDGKEIDEITLADQLQHKGVLDQVGGYASITQLTNRIETTAHAKQWVEIIIEKYRLRQLLQNANTIIDKVYHSELRANDILAEEHKSVLDMSKSNGNTLCHIKEIVNETMRELETIRMSDKKLMGISSGIKKYDEMTMGFKNQEMIVFAARPSMGKSALAHGIGYFIATDKTNPISVLLISLEMSRKQICQRLIFSLSQYNKLHYFDLPLSKERAFTMSRAIKNIGQSNIWIEDRSALNILSIRAIARYQQSLLLKRGDPPLRVIIIDYLQLISGPDKSRSRENDVAEISRGLKSMAREMDIPVIVLSQLNRDLEKQNRNPRLSDLRESGAIEQDADVVGLLYCDKDEKESTNITLEIVKQRDGPLGKIHLIFNKGFTLFTEPKEDNEPAQEEMGF